MEHFVVLGKRTFSYSYINKLNHSSRLPGRDNSNVNRVRKKILAQIFGPNFYEKIIYLFKYPEKRMLKAFADIAQEF